MRVVGVVLLVAAVGFGSLATLLPTALIGVCSNPGMLCNSIMLPFLVPTGAVVIGVSVLGFVLSLRAVRAQEEPRSKPRIGP